MFELFPEFTKNNKNTYYFLIMKLIKLYKLK